VYLEWFGKVPGSKRRSDVSHVLSDGDDAGGVGAVVAVKDDSTTVRKVLEDVRRGVLIHAHNGFAARLHGREDTIRLARGICSHTARAPTRAQSWCDG
jgi:hypothetical protein